MRFYVLGSDKKEFTIKAKKAEFSSDSFQEALARFDSCANSGKYAHTYLIVDFEIGKKPLFKASCMEGEYNERLPFFIIAEYHYESRSTVCTRRDSTIISRRGFRHEISNNIQAMREFEHCLSTGIGADWYIQYTTYNGQHSYERKIASTEEVMDRYNRRVIPVKKFKIIELNWEPICIEKIPPNFYTVTRKDKSSNIDKSISAVVVTK